MIFKLKTLKHEICYFGSKKCKENIIQNLKNAKRILLLKISKYFKDHPLKEKKNLDLDTMDDLDHK